MPDDHDEAPESADSQAVVPVSSAEFRAQSEMLSTVVSAGGVEATNAVGTVLAQSSHYSGPIPPPEVLAGLNAVVPGLAGIIVGEWQAEAAARRENESRALTYEMEIGRIREVRAGRGMVFGLVVALGGFLLSGFCAWRGQQAAAAVVGTIDLIGLVSIFVLAHRRQDDG